MLTKLIVNFFSLNGPIFFLLFCGTVYLVLAIKLKRMLNSRNFDLQSRIPLIDTTLLEKLLRTQLFEKTNLILNSVLIGFHLLLLLLVSLLFVSSFGSHGSSFLSLAGNGSVLNFGFSSNYQALINIKKQAEELKTYCQANHLNSICEINDQINQQISKKLENLRIRQPKLDKNDLKDAGDPKESQNFNDKNVELNKKAANDLNAIQQCRNVYLKEQLLQDRNSEQKANDKTDFFTNFYLTELDQLLSGQIGAALLGIIAVLLSLIHYSDTVLSTFLECKINKLIKNPKVNYHELNYTHIFERVLTPFAIYFDFKHPQNPAYLWFTISWSLLNIVSRFGYLRRLSNEKRFQTTLLLDDLLKTKVIFYSSLLLLTSYQMSLNSLTSINQLPNSVKIFNLFYSLLLFLISLSDYEKVLKQENRPINLDIGPDMNNNRVASSNGLLQPNMTNFNKYNNQTSRSTGSLLQPICNNLSRRY